MLPSHEDVQKFTDDELRELADEHGQDLSHVLDIYDHPDQTVDHVSDANVLHQHSPQRVDGFVNAVADVRSALTYAKKVSTARKAMGLSAGGSFFYTASIPDYVVAAVEAIDPETFRNKKKYYRWLSKHPEWKTGSIRFIG